MSSSESSATAIFSPRELDCAASVAMARKNAVDRLPPDARCCSACSIAAWIIMPTVRWP
jgi:hypothetical protein